MPIEQQIYLKNISQRKESQVIQIKDLKAKAVEVSEISIHVEPAENQTHPNSDGFVIDPARRALSQL